MGGWGYGRKMVLDAYANGLSLDGAERVFESYELGPGVYATNASSSGSDTVCDIMMSFGDNIIAVDYGEGVDVELIGVDCGLAKVACIIEDGDAVFAIIFNVRADLLSEPDKPKMEEAFDGIFHSEEEISEMLECLRLCAETRGVELRSYPGSAAEEFCHNIDYWTTNMWGASDMPDDLDIDDFMLISHQNGSSITISNERHGLYEALLELYNITMSLKSKRLLPDDVQRLHALEDFMNLWFPMGRRFLYRRTGR